ncbi:MAG: hypothetical protein WBA87_00130 [Microbacterium sp.]
MSMDRDTVEYQIQRVLNSAEQIGQAKKALASLQDGQTSALWTADGKCVDLAGEFKNRYHSSELAVNDIIKRLVEIRDNLKKAIDETDQLDADQKQGYQVILANALGAVGAPRGPIAV